MEAKPVLAGTTANEGTIFLMYFLLSLNHPPVGTVNYSLMNPDQLLQGLGPETLENTLQVLAQRYSQEGKGLWRYWWALDQAITDYYFMCPMVELAQRIAEAGSAVYAYSFTHASSFSIWHEWMGVPHAAELPYLFGRLGTRPGDNQTYLETDAVLSRRVMRYWADFARSGNPNGADGSGEQWPRYTATEKNLFRLSTEPPQVMEPSPARRCHFLTWLMSSRRAKACEYRGDCG
uniref:Carboxylesterase type B domain-containing protein n=1 Tax=Sphenodon punctatus TaxID=8508 RepID=A0A8D0G829_SPHPU